MTDEHAAGLVRELRKLPAETEWLEFKHDNSNPKQIGEYVSALSNSAAIAGQTRGYLIWGIEDETHDILGTSFSPQRAKVGGEVLENWLLRLLEPKVEFEFAEIVVDGKPVAVLSVERAFANPVRFQNDAFIRVGTAKKKLKDAPNKERMLWRALDKTPFEYMIAAEQVKDAEVLRMLDYKAFFRLMNLPLPVGEESIIDRLAKERLVVRCDAGGWNVTNLAAILLAPSLSNFGPLGRKSVRVVEYEGRSKVSTIYEQVGVKGYASGFEGLVDYINGKLPTREQVGPALRARIPVYPELAIRELVANALIHQDFAVTGAGPMIEIFDDRVEVTNPGSPLIDTSRFLNTPPMSRNEALASQMRRMNICEERGSGVDKIVSEIERYQLPAPIFRAPGNNTQAILLSPRPLTQMDREDRVRACYLHACLKYEEHDYLTNASIRDRFGIEERNRSQASRLIGEAVEAEAIRPYDPDAAPKMRKYLPSWA